jgi:hypothetical protein
MLPGFVFETSDMGPAEPPVTQHNVNLYRDLFKVQMAAHAKAYATST